MGGSTRDKKEAQVLDHSQRDRFAETARALGCDEDEAAFKAKLAVIARQKPKDVPPVSDDEKADD